MEVGLLAVEDDAPAVGPVHPGDAAHQRGLAGTVVADERGDLAATRPDAHIDQGADAAERLADVFATEQGTIGRRSVAARLGLVLRGGWGVSAHRWNLVRSAARMTT